MTNLVMLNPVAHRHLRVITRPGAEFGDKVGTALGGVQVSAMDDLDAIVRDRSIVVGVLAVPTESAQDAADRLVDAGVKIVFNYSTALIDTPADVQVHTSNPAVELLYALYFHLT